MIRSRTLKSGETVHDIRLVDPETGKKITRTVRGGRRKAEQAERKLKVDRDKGRLWETDVGRKNLTTFIDDEYWKHYALVRLAKNTRQTYEVQIRLRIKPWLGRKKLNQIKARDVAEFRAALEGEGDGEQTIQKTLTVLESILTYAIANDYMAFNPVKAAPKKKQPGVKRIEPREVPSLLDVERLRARLVSSGDAQGATMVSVLAYAGVRPGEMLALRHADVLRSGELRIRHSLAFGELKEPKTANGRRSIPMIEVLREDLAAWKKQAAFKKADDFLFAPAGATNGTTPFTDDDYRSWRRYGYVRNAAAVGLVSAKPYDLRHLFASLLIQSNKKPSIVEVAAMMGHRPSMTLDVYATVLDEFAGKGKIDIDKEVKKARAKALKSKH